MVIRCREAGFAPLRTMGSSALLTGCRWLIDAGYDAVDAEGSLVLAFPVKDLVDVVDGPSPEVVGFLQPTIGFVFVQGLPACWRRRSSLLVVANGRTVWTVSCGVGFSSVVSAGRWWSLSSCILSSLRIWTVLVAIGLCSSRCCLLKQLREGSGFLETGGTLRRGWVRRRGCSLRRRRRARRVSR